MVHNIAHYIVGIMIVNNIEKYFVQFYGNIVDIAEYCTYMSMYVNICQYCTRNCTGLPVVCRWLRFSKAVASLG